MTIIRTLGTASLTLFMAGMLVACGSKKEPESKSGSDFAAPSASAAADSSNQTVTIESGDRTVEINENAEQWPQDAPTDVPRYAYGTIRKIIRTETPDGNSWDMAIDGLPANTIRNYEAALKSKGFQTTSLIAPDAGGEKGSITGEKGAVTVVFIGSGSGATLSIIQKLNGTIPGASPQKP